MARASAAEQRLEQTRQAAADRAARQQTELAAERETNLRLQQELAERERTAAAGNGGGNQTPNGPGGGAGGHGGGASGSIPPLNLDHVARPDKRFAEALARVFSQQNPTRASIAPEQIMARLDGSVAQRSYRDRIFWRDTVNDFFAGKPNSEVNFANLLRRFNIRLNPTEVKNMRLKAERDTAIEASNIAQDYVQTNQLNQSYPHEEVKRILGTNGIKTPAEIDEAARQASQAEAQASTNRNSGFGGIGQGINNLVMAGPNAFKALFNMANPFTPLKTFVENAGSAIGNIAVTMGEGYLIRRYFFETDKEQAGATTAKTQAVPQSSLTPAPTTQTPAVGTGNSAASPQPPSQLQPPATNESPLERMRRLQLELDGGTNATPSTSSPMRGAGKRSSLTGSDRVASIASLKAQEVPVTQDVSSRSTAATTGKVPNPELTAMG